MKLLRIANILSKIARSWSLISIGFILLSVFGELFSPHASNPTSKEMVGIAFFPVGVLIGLALGLWREGLGGAIGVGSLVGFYIWCHVVKGRFASGPFFLAVAAPGIIFLLVWAVKRQLDNEPAVAKSTT